MEFGERTRDCSLSAAGKERLHLGMTSRRHLGVFPQAAAPVWVFSRSTTGNSGSLSGGAREVRFPFELRGEAQHWSRVMIGESSLKTL